MLHPHEQQERAKDGGRRSPFGGIPPSRCLHPLPGAARAAAGRLHAWGCPEGCGARGDGVWGLGLKECNESQVVCASASASAADRPLGLRPLGANTALPWAPSTAHLKPEGPGALGGLSGGKSEPCRAAVLQTAVTSSPSARRARRGVSCGSSVSRDACTAVLCLSEAVFKK